jgi:quinol monooxygenase YgiN
MTFRPDALEEFLAMFEGTSQAIRSFPGCEHLELWEDARFPNVLSTYSIWCDEAALEEYRKSELFRSTWARTQAWFAAAPVAQSQTRKVLVETSG